jgi:hypothetical protein
MRWLPRWFTRRPAARRPHARRFIPELTPLEERAVPTVNYYGGNVLPHVEAQGLYYGSGWLNNATTGQFEGYLQYLVNSPYMDMLTQAGYGVGRGSWSQGIIDPVNLPSGSDLLDSTIRSTIQSEINGGFLQNPDPNRLYVVFVQANVVVTNDINGGSSSRFEPHGFVGYHGAFAGSDRSGFSASIRYAVVVTPGGNYNGVSSTLPTFDQMTSIASHEIAEAATDPDVNYARNGWADPQLGEIGDIFANDDVFLNHYVVQMEPGQLDNPIAPQTTTYVAADFPGQGVWRYSSAAGWAQLTPVDASMVDADANGDVVGAFPGAGVYRFSDATGWVQLTPATAALVGVSGKGIVVAAFPGQGLFRYEDWRGWQQLTAATPSQAGVDLYGNVVAEFPGQGVFRFDDFHSWQHLTTVDAAQIAIGDNGVVAATFTGAGVWRYDNARGWSQLTWVDASQVSVDAVGDVVSDFGNGVFRFEDTQGWVLLTGANAGGLAGGAIGDVVAAFPGQGLWLYDDVRGWQQLTPANPSWLAIGA